MRKGGNWIIPDEALTSIQQILHQQLQGRLWLKSKNLTFTNIYWNIDAFGHSAITPFLLEKFNYQFVVLNRINVALKHFLRQNHWIEFQWMPFWKSSTSRSAKNLLTSILPFQSYNIDYSCGPHSSVCRNFDFRELVGDIGGFAEEIQPVNIQHLAKSLFHEIELKSRLYKHKSILFPFGDDFRFNQASEWIQQYENLNKLFHYINHNQSQWNVKIKFATLQEYFHSLPANDKFYETIPKLAGDFFVYSDRGFVDFWSGYYFSRPHLKISIENLSTNLRLSEILWFYDEISSKEKNVVQDDDKNSQNLLQMFTNLEKIREISALMIHHDSIAGTTTHAVTLDNLKQIQKANDYLHELYQYLFNKFHYPPSAAGGGAHREISSSSSSSLFHQIQGNNQFLIPFSHLKKQKQNIYPITLFNSDTLKKTECLQLKFVGNYKKVFVKNPQRSSFSLFTKSSEGICQLDPCFISNGKIQPNCLQLRVCQVLLPMKFQQLFIYLFESQEEAEEAIENIALKANPCIFSKLYSTDSKLIKSDLFQIHPWHEENFLVKNSQLQVTFDFNNGFPLNFIKQSTSNYMNELHLDLNCDIVLFDSAEAGGTYILDLVRNVSYANFYPHASKYHVIGPLTQSVHIFQIVYNLTFLLYQTSPFNPTSGFVQPDQILLSALHANLDVNLNHEVYKFDNVELALQCKSTTLIKRRQRNLSGGRRTFYTDVNGLLLTKREYLENLPMGASVYPVTRLAALESDDFLSSRDNKLEKKKLENKSQENNQISMRLNLLFDSSHGFTSPREGEFLVFLQRLNQHDDHRGNTEGIPLDDKSTFNMAFLLEIVKNNDFDHSHGGHAMSSMASFYVRRFSYPLTIFVATATRQQQQQNSGKKLKLNELESIFDIPCYLELLSVRTLGGATTANAGREFLIILMKRPLTCRMDLHLPCAPPSSMDGTVDIAARQLFTEFGLKQLKWFHQSSLDGIDKVKEISIEKGRILFDVVDVKSFILTF